MSDATETNGVFLKLTSAIALAGDVVTAGSIIEVTESEARNLLDRGKAVLATSMDDPRIPDHQDDPSDGGDQDEGGDGDGQGDQSGATGTTTTPPAATKPATAKAAKAAK